MPLRRKLLMSMLLPALLIGLVGIVGIASLRHMRTVAGTILSENYTTIQDARRMERSLGLLQTLPPDTTTRTNSGRLALLEEFDAAVARCDQNITEAGEADIIERIHDGWNIVGQRYRTPAPVDDEQALEHRKAILVLHEDISALVSLNEQAMLELERGTREQAKLMIAAVGSSLGIAVLTLTVFAVASANRISAPVVFVSYRLHQALNPGLEEEARSHRRVDEISRLQTELDALLERLRQYEDAQSRKLDYIQGQLVTVMNQVLEGLVLLDAELRVVEVNRVAAVILGCDPGESVRLADLEPRDDVREMLASVVEGSFQAERDLGELRFEVDGDERIYRPRVLPISASQDPVDGYLVLFWDVTEQRRFEESKHQLISMLSHELKTPMTSLTMSVSLLEEKLGVATAEQKELMSIAREDCDALSNLVFELIDAAREVTPDLTIRPRQIDLIRLLRAALRPLTPQAEEKGVTLVLPRQERSLDARVDPTKFPWVVTNLVGNALRFTGVGGRVEVTVESTDEGIEVQVSDTGAGISPDNLHRIFQPYVTLDAEPRPGTHGLGLAIAREIVEAHGGNIGAESTPGIGTTFRILMPPQRGARA